jgi:hypothetical protein
MPDISQVFEVIDIFTFGNGYHIIARPTEIENITTIWYE